MDAIERLRESLVHPHQTPLTASQCTRVRTAVMAQQSRMTASMVDRFPGWLQELVAKPHMSVAHAVPLCHLIAIWEHECTRLVKVSPWTLTLVFDTLSDCRYAVFLPALQHLLRLVEQNGESKEPNAFTSGLARVMQRNPLPVCMYGDLIRMVIQLGWTQEWYLAAYSIEAPSTESRPSVAYAQRNRITPLRPRPRITSTTASTSSSSSSAAAAPRARRTLFGEDFPCPFSMTFQWMDRSRSPSPVRSRSRSRSPFSDFHTALHDMLHPSSVFSSSSSSSSAADAYFAPLHDVIDQDAPPNTPDACLCTICCTQLVRCVCQPCGHAYACKRCLLKQYQQQVDQEHKNFECANCRKPITSIVRVFLG